MLVFPGMFRGAFYVRATRITEGMKLAAAEAIADLVGDALSRDYHPVRVRPAGRDRRAAAVTERRPPGAGPPPVLTAMLTKGR